MVNLDQKKAFDNVDHGYLFNTMRAMGFGNTFLSYLKLFYNGAISLIKVSGSLTAPFPFEKGIRQGCPLSGLLYSIALEPFLNSLRVKRQNKCFCLPHINKDFSVSAYADDISIFITSDTGFSIVQEVYNLFSRSSAACLNYQKSCGLWVGSWTGRSDKPLGFQWNNQGLSFLGVHLGNSNHYINQNWKICKDKLTKTISKWTNLTSSLSLKGKILVANQLAASKIFHCLAVLSPPNSVLCELQNMLVNFVWSNKRHLLRKQILFQKPDKGGLGLACLQARILTFRFSFIQRFLNLCPHPAYDLFSYNLRQYRKLNFDLHLFFTEIEEKFHTSLTCFYSEVLRAWKTSGARIEIQPDCINHVFNIPLNYPPLLPLSWDGNLVFPARLFECGIKVVKDLVNLTTGAWIQAEDVVLSSNRIRHPSRRLLKQDLAHLHHALCTLLPTVFNSDGFHGNPNLLRDAASSLKSPLEVKVNVSSNALSAPSKFMYSIFNQFVNELSDSPTSHWHDLGFFPQSTKIQWKEIYHLPSSKKEGDTQFKLMHNVLPSLPVLHHYNSDISPFCGWCGERGTAWHLFILCPAIQPALNLLHCLLSRILPKVPLNFDIYWTLIPHARGRSREAVHLSNFLIISLKNVIYWLYRTTKFSDPLLIWQHRIKNKIIIEYHYFRFQNNLSDFLKKWSINNALFLLNETEFTWLI